MNKKIEIISQVNLDRRALLKSSLAASAALSVGIPLSASQAQAAKNLNDGITWHKGVCRFCGTGCGLMVGVKNGRVIVTKGDEKAPVNRGLNCVKGYFNAKMMYGKDRLTHPLMRRKNGQFDKNGDFEVVSWDEAFDEMAKQFKRVYQKKGPDGVALIGSGQYTIPEAYAAVKLTKAGWRTNNIDPNARLCMASAVAGFYQTFGVDEPPNNYSDLEKSDLMLLWGNNMAEAHPVLWSRVANRKITHPQTRIINITTYQNLSSDLADETIIIKPNTDLAVLNFLMREILKRGAQNQAYIDKHCVFTTGARDIGYGLRPTDRYAAPSEKDTLAKQLEIRLSRDEAIAQGRKAGQAVKQTFAGPKAGAHWHITQKDFVRALEPYTLDFVANLAKGDKDESLVEFKNKLNRLLNSVLEKERNMMSFWCMGFNQHQRGVWVNEQIYALHLLLGKHAIPGNGAFSLTGQPSACGSAREVGTFSHRLPADLLVGNPKHHQITENKWHLPSGTLNPKVGRSVMHILRGLEDKSVNFVWTQVVNILQSTPNNSHWIKAARDPENFVVVADVYPTFSAQQADLILPASMHFEKWGLFGNGERRTQGWHQIVTSPGQARTDVWMMMEFAKRFKIREVWGEQPLKGVPGDKLPSVLDQAQAMGISPDATLFDVLFAPTQGREKAVWPDKKYPNELNATGEALGLNYFPEKALFDEYRTFGLGNGHDLADFDTYMDPKIRGLLWPVVNGKETQYRSNTEFDPYAKEDNLYYGPLMKAIPQGNLEGVTDKTPLPLPGKAKIFFRPFAEPVEKPDNHYDLWLCTGRILEHWHTGSMTMRVPEIAKAAPEALLYMNPDDAKQRGLMRADKVWIESRYGKIQARIETQVRNRMPKGSTWMAFFDENVMCNRLCLDSLDPISLEPDFKKTAVKVTKAA